ncbi:Arc family DNA-binding protein [Nocardiopsis sp. EMB25]|uniref:FitA-like ribbon-helix-helix domain-containing protein n=1 Tax=Nocardiopsis sp. EMB25 TaxID=2835867 RepID=UPI0022844478|nr:Arc family DNA-binding protein [Nocardiopsis sp. EMB25]MCY9783654.1 Arc family DNA-binding protein [Nocardiopsis sp. EMB25]
MKQVSLRLPDELHTALKDLAEQEDRSLHSQILRILRQATDSPRTAPVERDSPPA